jgi:hypothetical protein
MDLHEASEKPDAEIELCFPNVKLQAKLSRAGWLASTWVASSFSQQPKFQRGILS